MQELLVISWCDQCFHQGGTKRPAQESVPVKLGDKEVNFDLCTDCDATTFEPIRELMKAVGKRASTTPSGDAAEKKDEKRATLKTQCPECLRWMSVRNRQNHAKDVHDVNGGSIDWLYGPEVKEVWLCNCGMTFPTLVGRSRHVNFYPGHDISGLDEPVNAPQAESLETYPTG